MACQFLMFSKNPSLQAYEVLGSKEELPAGLTSIVLSTELINQPSTFTLTTYSNSIYYQFKAEVSDFLSFFFCLEPINAL